MPFLALLWRATYGRYAAASVVALGTDLALFVVLQAGGWPLALVSASSYAAGVFVHWLLSSRAVFVDRQASGAERRPQQLLFLLSAGAGLAITVGIVQAGAVLGLDPRLSKLVAVGISFNATYLLRARLVFV
jgi:putative flippase GtrA